jgi:hypothetical protein
MKKLAFYLGYAGGILALVCSLFMIYTVPYGLAVNTLDDIKYDMENENIVAFNETALAMQQQGVTADFNENSMTEFAHGVAKDSAVLNDEDVYEDTVAFAYKTTLHGIISLVLIGISVLFALLAFIGALVTRKKPMGGGIMMLIAALVLVLSAIYTATVIPMIAAVLLLTVAGIIALVPQQQQAYAHARRSRVKAAPQFAPPYPQQQFSPPQYQAYQTQQPQFQQPQFQQPTQPQFQQPQFQQPPQPQFLQNQPVIAEPAQPAAAEPLQTDVPFPEEEVQVFSPPAGESENIVKE